MSECVRKKSQAEGLVRVKIGGCMQVDLNVSNLGALGCFIKRDWSLSPWRSVKQFCAFCWGDLCLP